MGLLSLNRLIMSLKQDSRRRQIQGRNVSVGSLAKRTSGCSLAKRKRSQEHVSQTGKRTRYSGSHLPEDIWHHICSFLPLKDAARAACVSQAFLCRWRCHPNLTFSKEIMGFSENTRRQSKITRHYNSKVGNILKKHFGVGVKTLSLQFYGPYDANTSYCLDSWLQIAVTPGIEELALILSSNSVESSYSDSGQFSYKANYNFPCSLLSDGTRDSIRELDIVGCAFRPTLGIGRMGNLTNLSLCFVHITGEELGFLLSNSLALELLELSCCSEIIFMKIPSLQRLGYLKVSECCMLQVIESKAPNISSFHFDGEQVQLFLGEALKVKKIDISHSGVLLFARTLLLSSTPNVETLTIYSIGEMVRTPMLPSKFLHLKFLDITVTGWSFSPAYDLFSLVSFLDASPCLETFDLHAPMRRQNNHDSIFEDLSHLGQIPGHCYENLRCVKITSFCSTKVMVNLARHILEHTTSLESLTLDITAGGTRCSDDKVGECDVSKGTLVEAPKALMAIRAYIEGRTPSTVKLTVLEPCNRCNVVDI